MGYWVRVLKGPHSFQTFVEDWMTISTILSISCDRWQLPKDRSHIYYRHSPVQNSATLASIDLKDGETLLVEVSDDSVDHKGEVTPPKKLHKVLPSEAHEQPTASHMYQETLLLEKWMESMSKKNQSLRQNSKYDVLPELKIYEKVFEKLLRQLHVEYPRQSALLQRIWGACMRLITNVYNQNYDLVSRMGKTQLQIDQGRRDAPSFENELPIEIKVIGMTPPRSSFSNTNSSLLSNYPSREDGGSENGNGNGNESEAHFPHSQRLVGTVSKGSVAASPATFEPPRLHQSWQEQKAKKKKNTLVDHGFRPVSAGASPSPYVSLQELVRESTATPAAAPVSVMAATSTTSLASSSPAKGLSRFKTSASIVTSLAGPRNGRHSQLASASTERLSTTLTPASSSTKAPHTGAAVHFEANTNTTTKTKTPAKYSNSEVQEQLSRLDTGEALFPVPDIPGYAEAKAVEEDETLPREHREALLKNLNEAMDAHKETALRNSAAAIEDITTSFEGLMQFLGDIDTEEDAQWEAIDRMHEMVRVIPGHRGEPKNGRSLEMRSVLIQTDDVMFGNGLRNVGDASDFEISSSSMTLGQQDNDPYRDMNQFREAFELPVSNRLAHLLKTVSKDSNSGRPMPRKSLLQLLSQIYQEKQIADEVDDREGNERLSLAEFVYEFMLNRYGLRSLAEKYLFNLLISLKKHKSNTRIKMFSHFIGLSKPWSLQALNIYIDLFRAIKNSKVGFSFPCGFEIDAPMYVNKARALDIVNRVLGVGCSMSQTCLKNCTSFVNETAQVRPHKDITSMECVDCDEFVKHCIDQWRSSEEEGKLMLASIFRAGDVNGDGVLTLDEFRSICRVVDSTIDDRKVIRIFRDTLKDADRDKMTPRLFLEAFEKAKVLVQSRYEPKRWGPIVKADLSSVFQNIRYDLDQHMPVVNYVLQKLRVEGETSGDFHAYQELSGYLSSLETLLEQERDSQATFYAFRLLLAELSRLSIEIWKKDEQVKQHMHMKSAGRMVRKLVHLQKMVDEAAPVASSP
jgi:hypothetical protein